MEPLTGLAFGSFAGAVVGDVGADAVHELVYVVYARPADGIRTASSIRRLERAISRFWGTS
ncbi:MAG: hypothetical protein ACRDJ1_12265 [Actinomycetota bacterium]